MENPGCPNAAFVLVLVLSGTVLVLGFSRPRTEEQNSGPLIERSWDAGRNLTIPDRCFRARARARARVSCIHQKQKNFSKPLGENSDVLVVKKPQPFDFGEINDNSQFSILNSRGSLLILHPLDDADPQKL